MEKTIMKKNSNHTWEEFFKLDLEKKMEFYEKEGKIYDCLFAQQLSKELLESLFDIADKLRKTTKTKKGADFISSLLSHKRAMLYFVQPSTRTFLSFLNACHILGLKTSEIRDTSTSSEVKGESHDDTVRTFSSYVDMIIMRHPAPGSAERTSWLLNQTKRPVPVLNAGSGKDQHPTQALLDIYTLHRQFNGNINGKRIVMVGDLKRGRTVRSLSYLMKNYKNISIDFVSPKEFKMEQDILDFLKNHNIPYTETEDFTSVMPGADAIYMTRIQDEHDASGESKKVDYSPFYFKEEHLKMIKPSCILLHPLPRRFEIDAEVDKDERAVYWRQERNGMWIRAALIAYIFGLEDKINQFGS
ncbi:MAG: aspartate carbamoyltransferase [Elusimicrobiota bacterium]|nr:aspartate carbamoyltransferase [Elusimicrobiota bacterium]